MFFTLNSLSQLFAVIVFIVILPYFMAIRIWVKPSNLCSYKAEIICYSHPQNWPANDRSVSRADEQQPIVIRREFKQSEFGELFVKSDDLNNCDRNDPMAYIRITNFFNSVESEEFEILKDDLLRRKSSVVFQFGTVTSASKMIKVYHSAFFGHRRIRSTDFEVEIFCEFIQTNGKTEPMTIGSAIQRKGQKQVNIAIYEPDQLVGCFKDKIQIKVYYSEEGKAKKVQSNFNTTRTFLLQNGAFQIDLSQNKIQPYGDTNSPTETSRNTSADSSRLTRASSSRANSSGLTRTNSSSGWLRRACSLRRCSSKKANVLNPKEKSEEAETKSKAPQCTICVNAECQIAFIPCGHFCTCAECSNDLFLLSTKKDCPICRTPIKKKLRIQKNKNTTTASSSKNEGEPSTSSSASSTANCCVFCKRKQCEIALNPCGHCYACSDCSTVKLKTKCDLCRRKIDDQIRIYS